MDLEQFRKWDCFRCGFCTKFFSFCENILIFLVFIGFCSFEKNVGMDGEVKGRNKN